MTDLGELLTETQVMRHLHVGRARLRAMVAAGVVTPAYRDDNGRPMFSTVQMAEQLAEAGRLAARDRKAAS